MGSIINCGPNFFTLKKMSLFMYVIVYSNVKDEVKLCDAGSHLLLRGHSLW